MSYTIYRDNWRISTHRSPSALVAAVRRIIRDHGQALDEPTIARYRVRIPGGQRVGLRELTDHLPMGGEQAAGKARAGADLAGRNGTGTGKETGGR